MQNSQHPPSRRRIRTAVPAAVTTALTITTAALVAASPIGTVAHAQSAQPGLSAESVINSIRNQHQAIGQLAPTDQLGRPTPAVMARLEQLSAAPWVPDQARTIIHAARQFFTDPAPGKEGVALPENAPTISQFYWPTISARCIGGTHTAMGSAIAVAGPASIPAPGADAGQVAFLFTALGTQPAAQNQENMHVDWVNLRTLAVGRTALHNNGINPDGPATISGTATTGSGTIAAILRGTVNTTAGPCTFAPTVIIMDVK